MNRHALRTHNQRLASMFWSALIAMLLLGILIGLLIPEAGPGL